MSHFPVRIQLEHPPAAQYCTVSLLRAVVVLSTYFRTINKFQASPSPQHIQDPGYCFVGAILSPFPTNGLEYLVHTWRAVLLFCFFSRHLSCFVRMDG